MRIQQCNRQCAYILVDCCQEARCKRHIGYSCWSGLPCLHSLLSNYAVLLCAMQVFDVLGASRIFIEQAALEHINAFYGENESA